MGTAREGVQAESRGIATQYGIERVSNFIVQVAREVPTGVNTIRRYLALLDFVEQRVLLASHLPPEAALQFVRENFSGLEKISRIDKLNPGAVEPLLGKLYKGKITTRALEVALEDERKKNPSSITARRGQAISSRRKELNHLGQHLETFSQSMWGPGIFGKVSGPTFLPADWMFNIGRRGELVGYLSYAETSPKGFEEAFVQAAFGSRFFSAFFLVMPFVAPEYAIALDDLNLKSRTGVGLLQYVGGKLHLWRDPRQTAAQLHIDIQYELVAPDA